MARDDGYPTNWDKIRKRVYRRDGFKCQRCGASDTELHAHHIKPKSKGGSHSTSNLKTLCKSCHESVHGHSVGGRGGSRSYRENSTEGFLGWLLFFFLTFVIGVVVQVLSLTGIARLLPIPTAAVISVAAFSRMKHGDLRSLRWLFTGYGIFAVMLVVAWFISTFGILFTALIFGYLFLIVLLSLPILDQVALLPISVKEYKGEGIGKGWYVLPGLLSVPVGWRLTEYVLDVISLIDMARRSSLDTPDPVSWVLDGLFIDMGTIVLLSITIALVFTYRLVMPTSVSTIERGVVGLVLLGSLGGSVSILRNIVSLAQSSAQVAFGLLLTAVVALSVLWVAMSTRYPDLVPATSESTTDSTERSV